MGALPGVQEVIVKGLTGGVPPKTSRRDKRGSGQEGEK